MSGNLITQLLHRFGSRLGLPYQEALKRALAVSVFAMLLVVTTSLLNPAWYLNPPGQIDPWMYWGTGEIPEYAAEHFSLTYYFRRWTLIFPNLIFQSLFPPLAAQLGLRSLILFAILFLAGILACNFSKSIITGFFVMGLMSFSTVLIAGIGRTYHDGTGLILFLILLLLIEKLMKTANLSKAPAFFVGFVFGLLFVTYQFGLLVFLPFLLSILLAWRDQGLMRLRKYIALIALGFLTVDALDFLIGLFYGSWPELVSFAIFAGGEIQNSGGSTLDISTYSSIFLPPSLASVALPLLLSGLLLLMLIKSEEQRWFPLGLIGLSAMYLSMPFVISIGPQELHTSIYGWAAAILAMPIGISLIFDSIFSRFPRAGAISELAKLLGLSAVVGLSLIAGDQIWIVLVGSACVFILLGISLQIVRRERLNRIWKLKIAWIPCSLISISLFTQGLPYPYGTSAEQERVFENNSSRLVSLSIEVRALEDYALQNDSRIFLLDNRPHEGWSETISAFYGMYSSISEGYPAPPVNCDRIAYATTTQNPRFIVIHAGDIDGTSEFLVKYLAPCNSLTPIYQGEVPGLEASIFRLVPKLGP